MRWIFVKTTIYNVSKFFQIFHLPKHLEKANVIPVHKKDDKQCVNNYRPVSLLPVFGKIFEKLIFNEIYSFLDREKLLNTNQSGFRSSDSCVRQLLIITHKIFFSFECNSSLGVCWILLTSQKLLIKSGMKVCFTNLNLLVSLEIYSIWSSII